MFGLGNRRRRKKDEELGVQLPITPMLDMAFQIFAFFVAIYHPSEFEGQMQMNLPSTADAAAVDNSDTKPANENEDVKLPSEVTITIKSKQDGINDSMPSHYLVSTPQDPNFRVDSLDELSKFLARTRSKLVDNQEAVTVKADSKLRYTYVMQVMDVCTDPKKAGFKRVGFGPPPDLEADKSN